jgi:hypothetical protein
MENASGLLAASFYNEYWNASDGAYWSDTVGGAIDTLYNCSHTLTTLGNPRRSDQVRARENGRRACQHYGNAVEAFDTAWTQGDVGLIFHAQSELLSGDLELSGDGGSGSGGFTPSSGDLDCADVGGPIPVGPDDPNNLDGDGDGIGCE